MQMYKFNAPFCELFSSFLTSFLSTLSLSTNKTQKKMLFFPAHIQPVLFLSFVVWPQHFFSLPESIGFIHSFIHSSCILRRLSRLDRCRYIVSCRFILCVVNRGNHLFIYFCIFFLFFLFALVFLYSRRWFSLATRFYIFTFFFRCSSLFILAFCFINA